MRIALIAGTYSPERCGVADYTAQLRQALEGKGVKTVVLTTRLASEQQIDPTVQGVVTDWNLANLPALVRAVHSSRVDLLHIQHAAGTYGFQRAIFLLPLLLRLTGYRPPIVVSVHEYGWWEWQPPSIPPQWLEAIKVWGQTQGWWDREDGFLLTQSAAVIATNGAAAAVIQTRLPQLSQLYQIPIAANVGVSGAANVEINAETSTKTNTENNINPDALNRSNFRCQLRQRCGWQPQRQVIAFFGFLHPVKGIETLLLAFRQVLEACPEAGLILIGGVESLALPAQQAADYWQKIQQQVRHLHLDGAVHLTGYLPAEQVSELLHGADLGVLPFNHGVTLKSGSLLTLLAHNLPVVATQADPPDPGLAELPQLVLVPPRDSEALAQQLQALLKHPPTPTDSWQSLSQQFSWSQIAAQHVQIYQTVLQTSG
jgi:polysaccharide biosynthesis protein PslF